MVRTQVGYTGGQKPNPTYHSLGDHTETLQIDYDPTQTSYQQLLAIFWETHNPCFNSGMRQYMSAVFYHNEEQQQLALETRDREAARLGRKITTAILPAGMFYPAEDYHQKYLLRQSSRLWREFQAMYPDPKAFVCSTAAARVNGYLGGYGEQETLEKEIDHLGLSEEGKQVLRETWKRRKQ